MRSVAIETAFTFIYVVAIAYLIYVFLDKNGRIRSYIYLLSTLIVTAPFLIVSPVTARCFFANKIFWMLLGGEILSTAFVTVNRKYKEKFNGMAFAVAFCSVFLVINACLTNKYVDVLLSEWSNPNEQTSFIVY